MAKMRTCTDVKCPFYQADEKQKIHCEGIEPNTRLHLAFATDPQLLAYRHQFCEGNYCKCLIAMMLMIKYKEEETIGN